MPKIVIMAGGTGGHVFPGLAVAEVLSKRSWQVEWFGTRDKMEAQLVPQHGFPIHFIEIKGIRGKGIVTKLIAPFILLKAVLNARKILKQIQPDLALGMGGYASGPGGIAAWLLGIPLLIHEQNAVFGLTNRFLAKISKRTITGFDTNINPSQAKAPAKAVWLGNPVRANFFKVNTYQLKQDSVNVLITGGSLGAQALNQQLPEILNELSKEFTLSVMHQTGKGKLDDISNRYSSEIDLQALEFIDQTEKALEWADLVICRAGALTVAEIAATGRPAVFVPLPIAVDDHQTHNANFLVRHNAALLVQQKDIAAEMKKALYELLASPQKRLQMANQAKALSKQNAAEDVADMCQELVGKR